MKVHDRGSVDRIAKLTIINFRGMLAREVFCGTPG
jgi:hypothetical protein